MGLNAQRPSTTRAKEMEKAKADLMDDSEKTTRLNVELTVSQHRALKAKAAGEGQTIKQFISNLLDEALK